MATRYCPRCGNDIPSDAAMFCARCGERLEASAPALEPTTPPQPLPVSQPVPAPSPPYQPPPVYQPAPVQQHVSVNVQQAPITMNTVVMVHNSGPNILLRFVWFICFGLWFGAIATFWGYLFCLTVIGLPFGLLILNRLPAIMTLRPARNQVRVSMSGTTTTIEFGTRQMNFLLRALYFFTVGWWLTGFWLAAAWILALIWWVPPGIFMVGAFWMFDRVPAVLTLRRN